MCKTACQVFAKFDASECPLRYREFYGVRDVMSSDVEFSEDVSVTSVRSDKFTKGSTVASFPRREFSVELVESRIVLSATSCVADCASFVRSASGDLDSSFVSPRPIIADDNSPDTARDLGQLEETLRLEGEYVGKFDTQDVFRFSISTASTVTIEINEMSADADLYLLDENQLTVGTSTSWDNASEKIDGELEPGHYFAVVSNYDPLASTFYTLELRSTPTADPGAPADPDEPLDPPPASNDPPSDAPPSDDDPNPLHPDLIPPEDQPLPDVDYFGNANDWGLNSVFAPEAWAAGYTGQGVTVAIVDSGVQMDHPDLAGKVWTNVGETANDGIDNDGNGFVDDVFGWDFVENDGVPQDGSGHGTHVTGIVGAANNEFGVTGVAYDAEIMVLRVLDDQGSGSSFSVAQAIRYAVNNGADIVNLSLGSADSRTIRNAVEYAEAHDVLIVVASGNAAAGEPGFPARYSSTRTNVLSVGAHNENLHLASFSNQVGESEAIQIDAPGVSIYSTLLDGRYGFLSGTSMATPYVTGVAALVMSANPDLTSAQVRQFLTEGAKESVEGSDSIGRVNAATTIPRVLVFENAFDQHRETSDPTAVQFDQPRDLAAQLLFATKDNNRLSVAEPIESVLDDLELQIENEPDVVDSALADHEFGLDVCDPTFDI